MQNKKTLGILIGIVAVVLVAAALIGAWSLLNPKTEPPAPDAPTVTDPTGDTTDPTTESGKAFTVVVVHADGSQKTFQYRSEEEYVGTVLLEKGLIAGDEGQYGLYVKEVDGERAVYEENGAYWGFYIGEEYAPTGVDMTPIEEGAVYKLVYTKG